MIVPLCCSKCTYPNDVDLYEKSELIKCVKCGYLFKNPMLMKDGKEIAENIRKARFDI